MHNSISLPARQSGAILIIAMIVLLAMTIVGTTSMRSLTMEERMVSNLRDDNASFQAAESGLVDCETALFRENPLYGDPAYYFEQGSAANQVGQLDWWADKQIWNDRGLLYGYDAAVPGTLQGSNAIEGELFTDPVCIREHIGLAPDDLSFKSRSKRIGAEMYEVAVKGWGAQDSANSVIQSTVFARYK